MFTEKGLKIAPPDPEDLSKLYENPLLPIEVILQADRSSAYYNSGSKQTMYFAESRALVNYLMSDAQATREQSLSHFIAQVQGGAEPVKAARQAFGDLNQLQNNLDAFIKRLKPAPSDAFATESADSASAPRNLSPAELEARIAELEFARGRTDAAKDRVEHAIELDSSLAIAYETHGSILLRQSDLDDAEKDFQKAADLDPTSPLAHYDLAMVAKSRGGFVGVPLVAVQALEKAVSLDPDFADAWSELAAIYALRDETLKDALTAAQHAVSLAPGVQAYRDLVSEIQNDAKGGPRVARKSSTTAATSKPACARCMPPPPPSSTAASSTTSSDRPRLESRTEAGDRPVPAATPSSTPSSQPRLERRTDPADQPAAVPVATPAAKPAEVPPPPTPAPVVDTAPPRIYSMTGTIAEVSCVEAPQLKITLKAQTIVMHLHADDMAHLTVKPATAIPTGRSGACASLRGRNARISYLLVSQKAWDAEIQTIEITATP